MIEAKHVLFNYDSILYILLLMQGQQILYDGDPLSDFTMIRFLDRFVYRNPKKTTPKCMLLAVILLHILCGVLLNVNRKSVC